MGTGPVGVQQQCPAAECPAGSLGKLLESPGSLLFGWEGVKSAPCYSLRCVCHVCRRYAGDGDADDTSDILAVDDTVDFGEEAAGGGFAAGAAGLHQHYC